MKKLNRDKKSEKMSDTREIVRGGKRGSERAVPKSIVIRRIIAAALAFIFAFAVAGAAVFPGNYPLGIAAVGAASGVVPAVASFAGALVGSAKITAVGGAYAIAITVLILARIFTSVYLSSDESLVRGEKKKLTADGIRGIIRAPVKAFRELVRRSGNTYGTMLRENIILRLALVSVAALISGAWSVVEGGYTYYDLFGAAVGIITTPVITYLFYAARERGMQDSRVREIAIYFTCAMATLTLHGIGKDGGLFQSGVRFDFGVMFAVIATCALTLEYGVHRGAICGLISGLVMDPIYSPAYALGAIVCGILSRGRDKWMRAASVIACGGAISAWAVHVGGLDGMSDLFAPTVVACSVLVPLVNHNMIRLPPSLFGDVLSRRAEVCSIAEVTLSDMERRIRVMSDGMREISGLLGSLSDKLSKPERAELNDIVVETFEGYCRGCKNHDRCYGARGTKLDSVMDAMTDELSSGGCASAAAVPTSVAAACYNMGRILDEINLRSGRRIAELRAGDKLSVIASDYALSAQLVSSAGKISEESVRLDEELSKKLSQALSAGNFHASGVSVYGGRTKRVYVRDIDLSRAELGGDDLQKLVEEAIGARVSSPEFELEGACVSMRMRSLPRFECDSGYATSAAPGVRVYCGEKRSFGADCAKENEANTAAREVSEISGDTVTTFESDGKFYMIISDGMGSGREAALTSGVCALLLRRLILAGADLECAIKMAGGIIRSCGRECSTTVDIAEIDMLSGEARFIKSGAAPSFVLRDGGIFRLQSKTVPIGIMRALDAEMMKFDIEDGDRVVMVSDGVSRSYDESPWLLDMMSTDEVVLCGGTEDAAEAIVRASITQGSEDDVTAGVIEVKIKRAG